MKKNKKQSSLRLIFGMIILAIILLIIFLGSIYFIDQISLPSRNTFPPAEFTIIPAITSTLRISDSHQFTGTSTSPPATSPPTGTITINSYVQITGTGGDGLRLRESPSLSSSPLFLGYDSEVFLVTDGPRSVDGFTWWYLTAPIDLSRSGWAAEPYLIFIPQP